MFIAGQAATSGRSAEMGSFGEEWMVFTPSDGVIHVSPTGLEGLKVATLAATLTTCSKSLKPLKTLGCSLISWNAIIHPSKNKKPASWRVFCFCWQVSGMFRNLLEKCLTRS
ncbi:hypothetical protein [Crenobacter intestini]|uniref:Uncharacterized protein n=1 Tax=Crenobacter intestini TaxID=2563443 RepID=A0A4T0UIM6_9NEIS|nr:hypothetical protein [Crenobacter intestini]TIC78388.1 hypothetical protein E5K04_16570 [Crenobacter intestini]